MLDGHGAVRMVGILGKAIKVPEEGDQHSCFVSQDHLGSARIVTGASQHVPDRLDYDPIGEQLAGGSTTSHKFTGDERDSETNLDHTWFRQYSSQFGRWMTPDPGDLTAVTPYSPQSWNRYAYTLNDPINFADPSGKMAVGSICLLQENGDCQGGGLGGGGTCTIDGFVSDRGLVAGLAGSGAGMRCPNNYCGTGTLTPYQCLDSVCG